MNKYDDIINLPYKKSTSRKHMLISDRAAQFAPFAALTGHDDAIKETARLTRERVIVDDDKKTELNYKIKIIKENLEEKNKVEITYFVPDEKKKGGEYLTVTGIVKKINSLEKIIILFDGRVIPMNEIIEIEGELFKRYEFDFF